MNKKVLVTGANGFVGSVLSRELIKRGYQVRGMHRSTGDLTFIKTIEMDRFCGDLTNKECLFEAVDGCDYVVNVGGKSSDWGSYDSFYQINVRGVDNLIQASMKAGIKKFVQISSVSIHGFGHHVDTSEEGPVYPSPFPYCRTKKLGEETALEYYKKHSFPVTAIRPGNIFGENDRTTILPLAAALQKRSVPYVDKGKYLTCPVYIENLTDAIIAAMEKDESVGESFLITDGLKITFQEYTARICEALGVKEHWLSIPGWLAKALGVSMEGLFKLFNSKTAPPVTRYRAQQITSDYHFSIKKAEKVLGWKPRVDFNTAVERAVNWFLNYQQR